MLQDYIESIPEDKREAFKSEIANAIFINSREDAQAVLRANKFIESEFQSKLSTKHEESMAYFQRDKMPAIIEEEIKKRGTKQPWEIRIDELEARDKEKDRKILLNERKAQAIKALADNGIDTDLADFVIHEDEEIFKANIERLAGKFTSSRDKAIKELAEKKFGNQVVPKVGENGGEPDFAKMTTTQAMQYAQQSAQHMQALMAWKNKGK